MRSMKVLAMLLVLTAACVKQTDYDVHMADYEQHKKSINESGTAVDLWISQAQKVIAWVSANGAKFTCNPACSDPPPPPTPIPDGAW
jgi:hypothetical protein